MAKTKRELSDVKPNEISYVGSPANDQKVLFFKGDKGDNITKQEKLKIEIESDGTGKGTVVTINDDKMVDLRSFNFSFYNVDKDALVDCSYSKVVVESDDGFKRTETFYLSKGEKMIGKEILELLKEYSGKDDYEFVKAELTDDTVKVLKEAMTLVNTYKADSPDDLREAIGVLFEFAASATVEKEEKTEKENTDDNKDDKENVSKEDNKDEAAENLTKSIEAMTKSIEELTKEDGSIAKIEKALEKLGERLDVVEKSTGVKKSIDGQDDNEEGVEDDFPSLKLS